MDSFGWFSRDAKLSPLFATFVRISCRVCNNFSLVSVNQIIASQHRWWHPGEESLTWTIFSIFVYHPTFLRYISHTYTYLHHCMFVCIFIGVCVYVLVFFFLYKSYKRSCLLVKWTPVSICVFPHNKSCPTILRIVALPSSEEWREEFSQPP